MNSNKIKCLIGIDESYTQNKIINCFKYRDDYEIQVYERSSQLQNELKDKLFYDFYWLEYEDLDFEKLISKSGKKNVLFNSFCIRKGLIRKAQIAFYLKKYISKKPNSMLVKYLPDTHVFELDYLDYLDEALNDVYEVEQALKENDQRKMNNNKEKTKKFILKSSMTNKGAEILIFDSRKQLENYFQKRVSQSEDELIDLREWVIQEYIDNPLKLVNYKERKFHLRVYVVAVGNLTVYVYDDILALFSLKTYDDDDFSQLSDVDINLDIKSHITNTCVQLDDLKTESAQNLYKIESECVKRFWELDFDENHNDKVSNHKKVHIFNQVKECVCEIFKCLSNEPTVFQPLENAFELYGFDFLVNQNYNCYFLEANAFPDFKQTGDNLNDLIDCLFYQTISVSSDKYFKIAQVCEPSKMSLVYDKSSANK